MNVLKKIRTRINNKCNSKEKKEKRGRREVICKLTST